MDLPTGATIVCTFGIVLIIMAVVRPLLVPGRSRRSTLEAAHAKH